jgi:phospholipase C
MWERLERREIDHLRPSPASTAGDRPRPDRPTGTDLLPQIQHIVVLMMENHSYDNYFGLLAGRGEGLPLGPDGDPVAVNYLANGRAFRAHALTSTFQTEGNPTQTWHASHLQYGDGGCGGFASSVAATVPGGDPGVPMGYWTERDLPFYYGLARTFPLADHWFSSCLGPTYPNRRFLISGTAHGLIDDLAWDVVDYPEAGTIFDALTDHGISWVNYHNVRPVLVLLRRLLGGRVLTAVRRLAQVGRWLPRVFNRAVGNKSFTADVYPLGLARCLLHLRTVKQFFADADAGTLPGVSIVDPDFGAFSEENPQDIAKGESFAAEVINRVMHGPAWPHTLLIWLYDEHGGYYDHVPPPAAVAPDGVPARNYQLNLPSWLRRLLRPVFGKAFADLENIDAGPSDYTRYGFRVPAVIVSPYARPGYVCTTTLDHTSILKLIEQKWNLAPLTRRDATAASPLDALDLDSEPAFATPPPLPAPRLAWGSWASRVAPPRGPTHTSAVREKQE